MSSVIRLYGKMPIQFSYIFLYKMLIIYWLYDGTASTLRVTKHVYTVSYQDKDEILSHHTDVAKFVFRSISTKQLFSVESSITHNLQLKWKLAV